MATLLFNSNHHWVIIPSDVFSFDYIQSKSPFKLRCNYACWPVVDLCHEWGIQDYPGKSANYVASFIASSQPSVRVQIEDPNVIQSIRTGELYWIAIYPIIPLKKPIPTLCMVDSDHCYFGVATEGDETLAMFRDPKSYDAEAWLTVSIEAFEFRGDDRNDDRYPMAKLVILGEPFGNWTRADADPISS